MSARQRMWAVIVTAGCSYEIAALWSRLPTISQLLVRASEHKALRVLAWLWVGAWADHFIRVVEQEAAEHGQADPT